MVSFWVFDAFESLHSRLYKSISSEILSRVNAMIEAYAFYDQIIVSGKYFVANRKRFNALDPTNEIFEVVPSNLLKHAEMLSREGIAFERGLSI